MRFGIRVRPAVLRPAGEMTVGERCRFVAGVAQEMRTSLAVQRALIEATIARSDASGDARRLGESLLDVIARDERLVDGLGILAEGGSPVTDPQPVDLAEITACALGDAGPYARRANVEIEAAELAAAPTAGDPYLLERLVQNLLENAVRHNLVYGGRLWARTWADGGRVMVRVANTGPPIRAHETETLFQPFRRLGDRRIAPPPGTDRGFGLGLPIVRAIAGAHGGGARAEPQAGGGLVVTVTLPRAR